MLGTRGFRLAGALLAGAAIAVLPLTEAVASVGPHGASSLQTPRVFVDFWGPEWGTGFATGGYPSTQYQQYTVDFMHNLSTDPIPLNPLVQYGYQAGTGLYAGSWEDTANDPPAEPTVDQMGAEVARAAEHFGDSGSGQDVNNVIVIALPTRHDPAWFLSNGGPWCGYHYFSQFTFGGLGATPWVAMPYEPDAGANCWGNDPNPADDSFGHGYFDGVSHVLFHEIAEAITDYNDEYGWFDGQGNEVADLCNPQTGDFGAANSGEYFAVQGLWSNADNACDLTSTTAAVLTGNFNFGSQVIFSPATAHAITVTNTGDGDIYLGPGNPWLLLDNTSSYSLAGNTCPAVLHPSQTCQVQVQFAPRSIGTAPARLVFFRRVGPGFPQESLTGAGTLNHVVAVKVPLAASRAFVHGKAAEQVVTVTNRSAGALTFKRGFFTGSDAADFTIHRDTCDTNKLAKGATCKVDVRFAPKATGARRAELVLPSSAGMFGGVVKGTGAGATATLTGSGLHDGTLTFPESDGLGEHPSESVTVTAGGQAALHISSISSSGDFTETSNCPKTLAVGSRCVIRAVLRPKSYDAQSGTLTVTDSATPGRQKITLSGNVEGTWAQAYPGTVQFGRVPVGVATMMTVNVSVGEGAPFNVEKVTASGGFTVQNGCQKALLAPSCTITVIITPASAGAKFSGTLTIATGALDGTLKVPLSAFTP